MYCMQNLELDLIMSIEVMIRNSLNSYLNEHTNELDIDGVGKSIMLYMNE